MATRTKKRPKKKEKKLRQSFIPGAEPPSVPAIDKAAESYREARDARMELLKEEVEKQGVLLELMRQHDLTEYDYDGGEGIGFKVLVKQGEAKVKVRKRADTNGEAEE